MDLRWKRRFSNYQSALNQLNSAVDEYKKRELNDLENQGLIKAFEFTYELAWNVMKDFFEYQGNNEIRGSRDAIKTSFKNNLIIDGKTWLKMIDTRNITAHSYDKDTADEVINLIVNSYIILLNDFNVVMNKIFNVDE